MFTLFRVKSVINLSQRYGSLHSFSNPLGFKVSYLGMKTCSDCSKLKSVMKLSQR